MTDKIHEKVEDQIQWKWFWWPISIVLILWLVTLTSFMMEIWLPEFGDKFVSIPITERGEFGDMFGGLNALFSGLAFAGLIFTIYLQRKELELQRKELSDTRQVLKNQQMEMTEQNKTLELQRFENTFFSLLDTFNGIIGTLVINENFTAPVRGRSIFRDGQTKATLSRALSINNGIDQWFLRKDTVFGPYFRMIYNILLFIERSEFVLEKGNYPNKQFYVHLLRDQLTSHEVLYLACFGLRSGTKENFKGLIEKYSLLKMMDRGSDYMPFLEENYDTIAFD